MCGSTQGVRRNIEEQETKYLQALSRGLYLKRDLKQGAKLRTDDLYSAIPYQPEIGHINAQQYRDKTYILVRDLDKDSPITQKDINLCTDNQKHNQNDVSHVYF